METSGVGYICTTEDNLTHYLDAVTAQVSIKLDPIICVTKVFAQHPIESK